MGLNSMGLGFSFTGSDDGVTKTVKSIRSELTGVQSDIYKVQAAARTSKVAEFSAGVQGAVSSVSDRMTQDFKLISTGIESAAAQQKVATGRMVANLNLTNKAANKLESQYFNVGYALARTSEQVAQADIPLKQLNLTVKDVGFKSLPEYVKFLEVAGVKGEEFASTTKFMVEQLGLAPKVITEMRNQAIAIGKDLGIGKDAVQVFQQAVGTMSQQSITAFRRMDDAQKKAFIIGSVKAAGALRQLGVPADQVGAEVDRLGNNILAMQNSMGQLKTGLVNDLDPGLQMFAENLGGIDEAIQNASQSPDKLLEAMAHYFEWAKKKAGGNEKLFNELTERFSQQFKDQFSPALVNAVAHTGALSKAFGRLKSDYSKVGDQQATFTDRFHDGLDATAHFNRTLDVFATNMKNLADVGDNRYNKTVRQGTRDILGQSKALIKADKGFKFLLNTVETVNYHGLGGFVAGLDESLAGTTALQKEMGPLGGTLFGLGLTFKRLEDNEKKGGKGFAAFGDNVGKKLGEMSEGALAFLNSFIGGAIKVAPIVWDKVKGLLSGIGDLMDKYHVGDKFAALMHRAVAYLGQKIPEWWATLWGYLKELFHNISGSQTTDKLVNEFKDLWDQAKPAIAKFAKDAISGVVSAAWDGVKDVATPDWMKYGFGGEKPKVLTSGNAELGSPPTARAMPTTTIPTMPTPMTPAQAADGGKVKTQTAKNDKQRQHDELVSATNRPQWSDDLLGKFDDLSVTLKQYLTANKPPAARSGRIPPTHNSSLEE